MYIIQFVFLAILALVLRLTWKRVREKVIRRREAWLWTVLWLGAATVILWPDLTTQLAEMVGIGRGVDLAVYGSIVLLLILVFRLHIALDKLERTMTKLVRKEALRDLPAPRTETRHVEPSQDSPHV